MARARYLLDAAVELLGALWRFVRRRAVLCVSAAAAAVSMVLVPPDAAYAGYLDVRTIICLFCILGVAGALRNMGAFERAARAMVARFSTPRSAVLALVGATMILSMFATNDMALIMMLPLAAAALIRAGWVSLIPFTFVMLGLTANLGGMIMPFGNPQNLYLYSYYVLDVAGFLQALAVPFAVSMLLVVGCCAVRLRTRAVATGALGVRRTGDARRADAAAGADGGVARGDAAGADLAAPGAGAGAGAPATENARSAAASAANGGARAAASAADRPLDKRRLAVLLVLLGATIASVLRVVPAVAALAAVVAVLAAIDRRALRQVDYALLLTFVCFFVFAGNLARIPAVNDVVGGLMGSYPLLVSAGLSQVISNVPAAVLLSHFTDAWQPLLVGVNIGGAGTLVGSLASLITLQHFTSVARLSSVRAAGGLATGRFLAIFFSYNVAFLAILLLVSSVALA